MENAKYVRNAGGIQKLIIGTGILGIGSGPTILWYRFMDSLRVSHGTLYQRYQPASNSARTDILFGIERNGITGKSKEQ